MNGATIILGIAGILLLLISLYELITDKAIVDKTVYNKYTKESVDCYIRREGLWGLIISIGALLLAVYYAKELHSVFMICGWVLIALGIIMIRTASQKLEKK